MALNKLAAKRTRSTSTAANAPAPATETAPAAQSTNDIATMQQVLAKVIEMVQSFDAKLGEVTSRLDALEGRLDELKSELDAALEDADEADEADEDEADEDENEDADDVTADDIDCNKTYKQFTSMDADQQKAVLSQAMADSGIKSIQARTIRKDANAALAIAEVMCSDKFGWDVDDFLKD